MPAEDVKMLAQELGGGTGGVPRAAFLQNANRCIFGDEQPEGVGVIALWLAAVISLTVGG